MKALSVCQPWAFLLVNGFKDVENRAWKTQHRGPLLVHASHGKSNFWSANSLSRDAALKTVFARLRAAGIKPPKIPDSLETGGIVGVVTLVDCVEQPARGMVFLSPQGDAQRVLNSPWFFGPVGWLVTRGSPLPFVPLKGKLHLFDVDI